MNNLGLYNQIIQKIYIAEASLTASNGVLNSIFYSIQESTAKHVNEIAILQKRGQFVDAKPKNAFNRLMNSIINVALLIFSSISNAIFYFHKNVKDKMEDFSTIQTILGYDFF